MNILIVGYGSIGKRHFQNSVALGHKVEIYSKHLNKTIPRRRKYNLIIIASKTSEHLKDIKRFKNLGKNFFIEKPLAITEKDGKTIKKIIKGKKIMMGYNLIFHPIVDKIKKILEQKKLGKIFLVQIHCGSYLPNWRKRDYRKSYSASKKMGGGVLLDLVHEINYFQYLFPGSIQQIDGYSDKISNLDITSKDTALIVLKQKKRYIHISLNYWQKNAERYIKIYGENESLYADLLSNETERSRNQMYIDEIEFAEKYITNKKPLPKILGINQAIKDLKIINAVK
ncbi:MAG: Gfo/Idh/MocA family oxidoreductase [Nanoarchaeota archaeon]|nr:Gfo/Idh/MocA family oxidoreductase [Nanoarchaeota archaeon]